MNWVWDACGLLCTVFLYIFTWAKNHPHGFLFLFFCFFVFCFFFRAKLAAISTGVAKRENELKETIIQLKSDQLKISVQVTKILTMMLTY